MQTLLVVDDLPEIHQMLDLLLENLDLKVLHALSGDEGLALFEKNDVDIVLTDVRMPLYDGLQMLQEMQDASPDLVAIVMTGYDSMANIKRALKLHVFDFLSKPYRASTLLGSIRQAMAERVHRKLIANLKQQNPDIKAVEALLVELRTSIKRTLEVEEDLHRWLQKLGNESPETLDQHARNENVEALLSRINAEVAT